MSNARSSFLEEIQALKEAVSLPDVSSAMGFELSPGVNLLRRGASITGLILLESFVRNRTEEVLGELKDWPAQFSDFPRKFRDRATIGALPLIERYAKMLRRLELDYESEIITEVKRMASISPPLFHFTKFVGGDYTGNISDKGTEELLSVFQVKNCWNSMHSLSSDIGFGVPSVKEVLKAIVRNRHKCAHVADYSPSANDIFELPQNLVLVGICIDTALSASVQAALNDWKAWRSENFDWKTGLDLFFVAPSGLKYRLYKKDAQRATKILDVPDNAKTFLPRKPNGKTQLIVLHASDFRPEKWDIV